MRPTSAIVQQRKRPLILNIQFFQFKLVEIHKYHAQYTCCNSYEPIHV